MNVRVKFFGMLAEAAGREEMNVENVKDTDGLNLALRTALPALASCSYAVAVEKRICTGNCKLTDGDTVALLPPFAGG